jgi:hypothetical protein
MAAWVDRVLSPLRPLVSTACGRVCFCLLVSYLAWLAAYATIGQRDAGLFPSPWLTLSPVFPPLLMLASVLLGLAGTPTLGPTVYPVVLVLYSLFVCRKIHWGWLGVPFVLTWLELHMLVVFLAEIAQS